MMTETETEPAVLNETEPDFKDSAFYLPRQDDSIYLGIKAREYPDMNMIYGFINKQMGVKLRKHIAKTYPDEQTHYKNYIKIYNYEEGAIETNYSLAKHKWGRINANRSLSLSLFHRPTRHALAAEKYHDHDMVNSHPKLLLGFSQIEKLELTGGLEEYCADPKKYRYAIADHYKLKDKKDEDGVVLTAYEQAKKLPLRLAFGGGIYQWKKEYVPIRIADMELVNNLETDLKIIRKRIVEANPHIRADLETDADWADKNADEKNRSIMAMFAQTWERIIQEYCIAYLVRTHNLQIGDIIPSQDGFMTLKKDFINRQIDTNKLYEAFNRKINKKFGIDVRWEEKPFNEAIFIPRSDIVPIDISLGDLNKGEAHIAASIAPALKSQLFYSSKTKLWYYTNKNNIWMKTAASNDYLIATTIQRYIVEPLKQAHDDYRNAIGEEAKKAAKSIINELENHYKNVGKSSYISQTIKYLRTLLLDNEFEKKLDNTAGLVVFADGIFDLKTGEFRMGIRKDDYVSFTLSVNYPPDFADIKMADLRNILKKILNWNDEHLEYYLGVLGYAFTGSSHLEKSIYYIVDGTEGGKGDNGKTFFFDILTHLLPEYVKQTNPNLLEDANTKTHKQLPELNGARIVFADEGTKKKLNAALMKKIGDGMKINTDVMYGNTVDLMVSYKMFVCSNHIPKIDKDEQAVYNRYKQIQFCSHFDRTGCLEEENYETLEFIADTKLGDKLKEQYSDEIISLLLEYGMKYYMEGIPAIPKQFIDAVNKTKTENNAFAKWFYENYEVGAPADKIAISAIEEISSYKRKEIVAELAAIGIKWNKNLSFGTKIIGDKGVRDLGGITGYKRKEEDFDVVEE